VVPWAHPSLHPKLHADRISRFPAAHRRVSLYFTMGRDMREFFVLRSLTRACRRLFILLRLFFEVFTLCLCSCMFVSVYISICCFVANNCRCCATRGPRKFRPDCKEVERSCYDYHRCRPSAARCDVGGTLKRPASVVGSVLSVVGSDTSPSG